MASAATLTATTLEGQLLECVELIAGKQVLAATNPNGVNMITAYNTNSLTNVLTVTLSIPVETDVSTGGSISTIAQTPYLD